MINRKQHPPYKDITAINFPEAQSITLDNGMKAYLLDGVDQDILKLDILVGAGARFCTDKLTPPLTGLMLNEGTAQRNAHQLAEQFDFFGAYFQPSVEKDNAFVGLISLTRNFEDTLKLVTEIINESIFPENELHTVVEQRKNKFLVDSEKTSYLAREAFFALLFGGNHPYGRKNQMELYNEVKQEQLASFFKQHYHAGNMQLIVSGKIDRTTIKVLNEQLGMLSNRGEKIVQDHTLIHPGAEKFQLIEKPEAVQSSIRMGLLTVNKTHPDYLPLKVLSTILGGYFGSRLMKNIREEKGYTYGIHAMQVSLIEAGYLAIAADVQAEFTKEAIIEVKKEMTKLKEHLILEEELKLVRNYMMGDMLQLFDGPFATSEAFKSSIQYDMGFDYFEQMKETILTITAEELKGLANRYFNTNDLVTVVAGRY